VTNASAQVPQHWLLGGLSLVAVLIATLSLAVGDGVVNLSLLMDLLFEDRTELAIERAILLEVRLPRAILAILIGGSLGLAGAAMQGLLRNPLAEPGILGVSGCAALGAILVFYFGAFAQAPMALPIGGMIGAAAAVLLLYFIAGRGAQAMTLILAGIAINAFAGAMMALTLNLTPNPFAAYEIVFWQMGSVADRSLQHVWLALPMVVAGSIMLLISGRGLALLTLGEVAATSLGLNVPRLVFFVIVGSAFAVGAGVAVAGVIGFVGLVVPHLLRPLVQNDPARLLSVSGVAGAVLLLCADVCVRLVPSSNELKLGVLTALLGAPFFVWLLVRMRRGLI